MSRSYASLISRLILLSFLAVLSCTAPALADTYLTWNLSGVTLVGGGSANGKFTYDVTTQKVTDWYVTAKQGDTVIAGTEATFIFTPLDSMVAAPSGGNIFLTFIAPDDPGAAHTVFPTYWLQLAIEGGQAELDSPGTVPLRLFVGAASWSYYAVWTSYMEPAPYAMSTGALTAVPLPPSAVLLASGLIALAWARRKKGRRR